MERLSGLDASFLYLESPAQMMHVCGLILLDPATVPGGYSFDRLRDDLAHRVRTIPAFHRKLRSVPLGIDHPVWVEDTEFDIDRHVHRMAVPSPGGWAELSDLCAHMASIPLDRSRPLWEMAVIEGLASGQVAVFTKMHHASVDGVSGANMISVLCSLEPGAPLLDLGVDNAGVSEHDPSDLELFARGVVSTVARPWRAFGLVRPTASLVTRTIERVRSGTAMAAPLTAPRTPFNGNISGQRAVAFADLSLDQVKEIRHAVEGATVNDVVLAVAGGALRRYLERHDALPGTSLLASVPVSVHDRAEVARGTNRVSTIFARLGTDIADPVVRLEKLAKANAHAKGHFNALPADALQEWAQFAAPRTFGLAVRMVADLRLAERGPVIHNLVISNVPGPPVPLYFLGARIDGLYPLGPIFHGAGLNITVMSTAGRMNVGLIACRKALPDIDRLAEDFGAEVDALYAATVG
ncbi:MAG TPA: wax ester/triacylglycerol synthase family O-acyltransferase [Marmoricola sp.]|nr:wax ester/triacylglycerol synthase family O-acyltransferase [Marmoricola sp.]